MLNITAEKIAAAYPHRVDADPNTCPVCCGDRKTSDRSYAGERIPANTPAPLFTCRACDVWEAHVLRRKAQKCREDRARSFERCDTDGFLSQWASGITASEYEAKARLVEAGRQACFTGLYHGDERIPARVITNTFHGNVKHSWLLRDDAAERFGRKFIPCGERSRIQKNLGLSERDEMAPAWAKIGGEGRGLSGCASARIVTFRTGDDWGLDATLVAD